MLDRTLLNGLPDREQVVQIPLQLFRGAPHPGRAHDQPHTLGHVEGGHGFFELGAVIPLDTARHTARTGVIGHEHQIATGQTDEGGQGRPLVATLFLVDLDDELLAFLQGFLENDTPFFIRRFRGKIISGNFLERQEAVTLGAVIDENGFEARLDAGDDGLVDIGLFLLARRGFDVDVVEFLTIDKRDAQLLGVRRIDQHALHDGNLGRGHPRFRTQAYRRVVSSRPENRGGRHEAKRQEQDARQGFSDARPSPFAGARGPERAAHRPPARGPYRASP